MVISGGDHLEWPTDPDYFQQYFGGDGYDNAYDDIREKEVKEMEQAFDEAVWEWTLEQGPPQDDDVVWLKDAAAYVGMNACLEYMSIDPDYSPKEGKAWGNRVREKLSRL